MTLGSETPSDTSSPGDNLADLDKRAAEIGRELSLGDRILESKRAEEEAREEVARTSNARTIKPGEVDLGAPISPLLALDIGRVEPDRPKKGFKRIPLDEIDMTSSIKHLDPGKPEDFPIPDTTAIKEPFRSPESDEKRLAIQAALGGSFGERIGAKKAEPIVTGVVQTVVDRRTPSVGRVTTTETLQTEGSSAVNTGIVVNKTEPESADRKARREARDRISPPVEPAQGAGLTSEDLEP